MLDGGAGAKHLVELAAERWVGMEIVDMLAGGIGIERRNRRHYCRC